MPSDFLSKFIPKLPYAVIKVTTLIRVHSLDQLITDDRKARKMNRDGRCSDVVLDEAWSRYTVSSWRCEAGYADAGRLVLSHHRTKEGRKEVNPSHLTTLTPSLAPLSPQADRQRWQSMMNRVTGHVNGIKYNYWGVFSHVSHFSPKIPRQHFLFFTTKK